jgi:nicotinamide riboside transporter PnuC
LREIGDRKNTEEHSLFNIKREVVMKRKKKKKPYLLAIFFGIISVASYIAVFSSQKTVTEYTTRGALYAALPVAAALYFSFIHGTFASAVLSVLGIEAKKKKS